MKKALCFVCLCVLTCGLLAACNNEPSSLPSGADVSTTPSGSAAPSVSPSASAGGPASAAQSEQDTSASFATPAQSAQQVESSITGTINDVAMGQVYVDLEDGRTIAFDYTTADIANWDDTLPGARVKVYFYGTLDEGTANRATRIETVE